MVTFKLVKMKIDQKRHFYGVILLSNLYRDCADPILNRFSILQRILNLHLGNHPIFGVAANSFCDQTPYWAAGTRRGELKRSITSHYPFFLKSHIKRDWELVT